MKYACQILSNTRAVLEIIPETDIEKSLFNEMNEENPDEDTLRYHYNIAIELINKDASVLGIGDFIIFPTKVLISYDIATGFGE